MSSLEAIRNFVQLTEQIGTAGQPEAAQFELIAKAGFDTVINIAMPDHPDSIDHEGKLVTELGMNYYHLPVPFQSPQSAHVRHFCELLRILQAQRLFVHCIMNYRVSAFMYLYLTLYRGQDPQQARSPIFDRWDIEPQWQALLQLDAEALGLSRE